MVNPAGYSGTPLAKKLGMKDGYQCFFHQLPDYYFNLFNEMPDIEPVERLTDESLDFAHVFVIWKADMETIAPKVKAALKKTGMVWLSWPKQKSGLETDLNSNIVRAYGLDIGLVDTKVAAVDDTWSGLKFMYRIKDR